MDQEETLPERIERFRTTYLEPENGNDHRLMLHWEQNAIRSNYADIQIRRTAGHEVTDLVLDKLLPHTNSAANLKRDVHVSYWGAISKNVRVWFETMKWKTAEDWPGTALWILDMVEAGRTEDWDAWNSLATSPMQKGFACGFITPIVYCLNSNQPVINTKVLKTYKQVAKELGIKERISPSLTEYLENKEHLFNLVEQLKPLGIYSMGEWDIYCVWNISKRLGGKNETSSKVT